MYQQTCAKASPNNRDKFGRFSNHSGYDLTLVSESLTFCKSANKTPPTGRFRVIRFSTKRSTFYCIILASRSHPPLQHEGRTSIPAITGYTAGAGYARPMQALALASRASPDLVSGLCPVSVRSARPFSPCLPGQQSREKSSELRSVQRSAPSCGSLSLSPASFAPCGIIASCPAQSVDSGYPLRIHSPTNLIERSHAYGYPRRNSRLSPPAA